MTSPVFVAEGFGTSQSMAASVIGIARAGGVGVVDAGATDADGLSDFVDRVMRHPVSSFGVYLPGPVARSGRKLFEALSSDYPQHVAFAAKLKYELAQANGRVESQHHFDADRMIEVIHDRKVPVVILGRECPLDLVRELSRRSKTVGVARSVSGAFELAQNGASAILPSHSSLELNARYKTYLDAIEGFRRDGPRLPLIASGIYAPEDVLDAYARGASGVWTRRWPTSADSEAAYNTDTDTLAESIRRAWAQSGLEPLPPRLQETMFAEIEASLLRFDMAPAGTSTKPVTAAGADVEPSALIQQILGSGIVEKQHEET